MKKVLLYSILLLVGLIGSQLLPGLAGENQQALELGITLLTMVGLAFIMIQVGLEFEIDKSRLRSYGWDYVVAMTAAAFPWIFVTAYFVLVMLPASAGSWDAWKESLIAGRFAAPTSAGVLFSMLAAAGLGATWLFKKTRILAIFDDLDTILLMIPLKILIVGLAWQLGLVVIIMAALLWAAWRWLHAISLPTGWRWLLGYAVVIVAVSEVLHLASKQINDTVPIHIEVLLPAFVLGCVLKRPGGHGAHDEHPADERAGTMISAAFMVLVGLSMPAFVGQTESSGEAATLTATQPAMSGWMITLHVLAITALANLGKMFPAFCYRKEAHWKERLALAIGMWPRGEVGAGILVLSLGYGLGGPVVTVAVLSLALNLVLTGFFILAVKKLLQGAPAVRGAAPRPEGSLRPEGGPTRNHSNGGRARAGSPAAAG